MAPQISSRVRRRPDPNQWAADEPLTLSEAIALFWPEGPITISSLRTEIRNGRLTPGLVAGRFYVTPAQLRDLFRPIPCQDRQRDQDSTFAPLALGSARPRSGSSVTDRRKRALDAARTALKKLSSS